jgi:hypothetical protein
MCLSSILRGASSAFRSVLGIRGTTNTAPQRRLYSPPPVPLPPTPPLPTPRPLFTDVNPNIRRARSEKEKNPFRKGTKGLRIKLSDTVNTGSDAPVGGNY